MLRETCVTEAVISWSEAPAFSAAPASVSIDSRSEPIAASVPRIAAAVSSARAFWTAAARERSRPRVVRSRATPETASESRANEARIRSIATIRPWKRLGERRLAGAGEGRARERQVARRRRGGARRASPRGRGATRPSESRPSAATAAAVRTPAVSVRSGGRARARGRGRRTRAGRPPERARRRATPSPGTAPSSTRRASAPMLHFPASRAAPSGSETEPRTVPLDLPETLARVRSAVDARLPELLERGPSAGLLDDVRDPLPAGGARGAPLAREAGAARPRLPRRGALRREGGEAPRPRLRRGDGPRRLARPRRPPVDGRRHDAPGTAGAPRGPRRGPRRSSPA